MAYRHDRSKIDNNQREIIKALRSIPGVTVQTNHDDFLVGHKGRTYWFECKKENIYKKDGEMKKGALKDSQIGLLKHWTGHYSIVWTLDQILKEIGIK